MVVLLLETSQVLDYFWKIICLRQQRFSQVASKQEAKFVHLEYKPSFEFHALPRVTTPKALSTLYNDLKLIGVSDRVFYIVLGRMNEH